MFLNGFFYEADQGKGGGGGATDEEVAAAAEKKKQDEIAAQEQANQTDVPGSWDEIFQHPRFKALNVRATEAEAEMKKSKDEKSAADKKALEDQNKFKELYEGEVKSHEETKGTLESRDQDALRVKIGAELGLSPDLAARLVGEDEETIRQDGEKLADTLGIEQDEEQQRLRKERGIPPHNRKKSKKEVFDLEDMTPAEIRDKRAEIWQAGQEGRIAGN